MKAKQNCMDKEKEWSRLHKRIHVKLIIISFTVFTLILLSVLSILPAGSHSQNLSLALSPSYSFSFILPSPSSQRCLVLWKIAALTRHDLKTHWRFRMLQHSYITVCGCVKCLIPLPRVHTITPTKRSLPLIGPAWKCVCVCVRACVFVDDVLLLWRIFISSLPSESVHPRVIENQCTIPS